MGIPEKIKAIQDEIHKTQINKATEFHVGLLKAKIARLKREMDDNTHGRVVSTGGASSGFDVRKAGDATVVLIGLPSVGKSTFKFVNKCQVSCGILSIYNTNGNTWHDGLLWFKDSDT